MEPRTKAERRTTRGGKPRYSGLAIATALTLRAVFRLNGRADDVVELARSNLLR